MSTTFQSPAVTMATPLRVLVLASGPVNRRELRAALKRAGADGAKLVVGAPAEWKELLEQGPFGLVLFVDAVRSDRALQRLPLLKKRAPALRVVVISEGEEPARVAKLRQAGAVDCLTRKQVQQGALAEALGRALGSAANGHGNHSGQNGGAAEQPRGDNEDHYRVLFGSVPVPTFIWKRDGDDFVLVDYNQASEAATGGAVRNFAGVRASEHHADNPPILEDLHAAWKERRVIQRDVHYRMKSTGPVYECVAYYVPVGADLVMVHTTDITERNRAARQLQESHNRLEQEVEKRTSELRGLTDELKAANEELRAANEELQAANEDLLQSNDELADEIRLRRQANMILLEQNALLDLARDSVIVRDLNDRCIYWNRGAELLYGWSRGEALGQVVHQLLRTQYPVALQDIKAWAIDSEEYEAEQEQMTRDGRRITVSSRWAPKYDEQGQLTGFLQINRDITERKRIEEEFRNQAALLELAHDAIMVCDTDDRILYWNRGAERTYGFSRDDVIGKTAYRVLKTHFPVSWAKLKENVLQTGLWEGEIEHTTRDGRRLVMASRWAVRYDDQGKLTGLLQINRDATERKKYEQALLEQASLFDLAHDAVFVCDLEDRIVFWNRGAETTYGYSKREAVGRVVQQLLHTHYPLPLAEIKERVLRDGQYECELIQTARNGRTVTIASRWAVQRNSQGEPRGFMQVDRDVTESRRAQVALHDSEERLRTTIEAVRLGMWDYWPVDQAVIFSDGWYSMLGYTQGELAMSLQTWFRLVHPDDLDGVVRNLNSVIESGSDTYESEFRMRAKSGEWRWVLSRGRVTEREADGRPVRMQGVHIDITERKRIEEHLLQSEERLAAAIGAARLGLWEWQPGCQKLIRYTGDWYREFGLDPDQLPQTLESNLELMHPDDREQMRAAFHAFGDGRDSMEVESRMRAPDGIYRWLLTRARVVERTLDGKPVRILGGHLDITERKQAEEELRLSREDLKRAQAVARTGSWRLDVQHNTLSWSDEVYRMFGVPAGEAMTYERFLAAVHPDDRAYVDAEWTAALGGAPYDVEHRIVVDGQVKWVRFQYKMRSSVSQTMIASCASSSSAA